MTAMNVCVSVRLLTIACNMRLMRSKNQANRLMRHTGFNDDKSVSAFRMKTEL